METKIMEIPVDDLLQSLGDSYTEYKKSLEGELDEMDLWYIKGFCSAMEQILSAYGEVDPEKITDMKKNIIGSVSFERKKKVDFDTPTYIRRQNKKQS